MAHLPPQAKLALAVIRKAISDASVGVLRGHGGSSSAPTADEQQDALVFLAGDDGRLDAWASVLGVDGRRLVATLERAEVARRPHARTAAPASDAA